MANGIDQRLKKIEFTIADGQTTSNAAYTGGLLFVYLKTDAAFDGASFTFEVADSESGTFANLEDGSGTNITITVGPSDAAISPTRPLILGPAVRIVSNAAQSGAASVVTCYFREA